MLHAEEEITSEERSIRTPCADELERRERLVAEIVRDFMSAYALARRVGEELRAATLEFSTVDRLVGDSPRSILYRLKEGCHALFRGAGPRSGESPGAGELFDLAVGALFHEAMKFRESYYLFTTYGPRARRSLERASAGPLGQGFRRLFDAGYRRMLESEAETEELLAETREQLRILLREWGDAGEVARSLLADPEQTERVFAVPLAKLLEEIFGSASRGYTVAVRRLLHSGHYQEAAALLERPGVLLDSVDVERDLVRGLATYYEGDPCAALELLKVWASRGARSGGFLHGRTRVILRLIAYEVEETHPDLAEQARQLERDLTQRSCA